MAKKKSEPKKTIRVTLVKSAIGYEKSQGETVKALGLGKLGSSVEVIDNPSIRGQINKVRHLLAVDEGS